ncbi:MAG: Crp/Fnr family transcriptional regulator [Saprospiraceae bacterium]|nr:Crp/Fnr family transcriptional regulator [Saprospiraceae bacterium]
MEENTGFQLVLKKLTNILPESNIAKYLQDITVRHYEKGQIIYDTDDVADKVYFVAKGRIKLGAMGDSGREIIKTIVEEDVFFGELSLIENGNRIDTATAAEDCVIAIFEREEFNNTLKGNPALKGITIKTIGEKLTDLENKLESIVFMDSRSRIISFLISEAEKRGQRVGYEWVVRAIPKHQDIANITVTSRQSVTSAMNDLRNADLITFDRKRLLIRDLEKLKALINT